MFKKDCCQKLAPLALLFLRVVVGVIMVKHGLDKWQDGPENFALFLTEKGVPLPLISAYLAIAGEFLGGLGLILGFLTPIAAFGVACVMAVAITGVHWGDGLFGKNGFEYPITIFAVALFFLINGAGKFSVDHFWCCKKNQTS